MPRESRRYSLSKCLRKDPRLERPDVHTITSLAPQSQPREAIEDSGGHLQTDMTIWVNKEALVEIPSPLGELHKRVAAVGFDGREGSILQA